MLKKKFHPDNKKTTIKARKNIGKTIIVFIFAPAIINTFLP